MGTCREWKLDSRELTRHRKATSRNRFRRWYRTTLRRLMGVDSKPLHRLSGLQAPSWRPWRIQRQVYVRPDDSPWGILRHARESLTRNLPQFLSAGDAVAIYRNTFGRLKGSQI